NGEKNGDNKTARQDCLDLIVQFDQAMTLRPEDAMLRYEAFTRLFALLGSNLDSDAVAIVQTSQSAMNLENLPAPDRSSMALHLRHLADELEPLPAGKSISASSNLSLDGPFYDRVSFGEQEQLVHTLREKPSSVSLDDLLKALVDRGEGDGGY